MSQARAEGMASAPELEEIPAGAVDHESSSLDFRSNLSRLEGLNEFVPVDTSSSRSSYLLVTEAGIHIELSADAYRLTRAIASGKSMSAVAQEVQQSQGREVSEEEVRRAYRHVMEKLAPILDKKEQGLPSAYWLRCMLLPAPVVEWIAQRLSPVFRWIWTGPLLVLLVATSIGSFYWGPGLDVGLSSVWVGYLLFFISMLAHEFGHASACSFFGAKPSDIGFTMYLVYPALYSDVSSAWGLSRYQRVVVDVSGTYFQLILGSIYSLLFLWTGYTPLWTAYLMVLYCNLFGLNPIFKFDGYWLVADALGVTNLASQPGKILSHFWKRLRGQEVRPLPWPRHVLMILSVYTSFTIVVWSAFAVYLWPLLRGRFGSYWSDIQTLASHFQASGVGPGWNDVQSFLVSTFLALMMVFMLWRLASSLYRLIRKKLGQLSRRDVTGEEPETASVF